MLRPPPPTRRPGRAPAWPFALALALASPAAPAGAAAGDWSLRLGLAWVEEEGPAGRPDAAGNVVDVRSDAEIGLGLGAEYRLSRRWSLEAGVDTVRSAYHLRYLRVNENFIESVTANLRVTSFTVGPAFYPLDGRYVGVRLGPVVGYEHYDSVVVDEPAPFAPGGVEPVRLEVEDAVSYGGAVGVALYFAPGRWRLDASGQYLRTEVEAGGGPGSGSTVDRIRVRLALGVRLGRRAAADGGPP